MSDRIQSKIQGTNLSANLSAAEKRALLAELLQFKMQANGQVKAREAKPTAFPLSHGQQSLWFLYQLAPQSWAYNTLFSARIRSTVNVVALQQAFQILLDRHPSLRTIYCIYKDQPQQQIQASFVPFEQINATGWSETDLYAQVQQAAYRPFVLEQDLPLRVQLFTRSPDDHVLLLVIHHIASDFWSLLVLLDELRQLYPSLQAGISVELPPLPASYATYVQQQTDLLASDGDWLWQYWQQQLAGDIPILNLPTDFSRPPAQTFAGASHRFQLSADLTQSLKAIAQTEKATLYMLLLAAFQALLYRYTGQDDIWVGSPTFGRNRSEFARVVGYFVNFMVLRSQIVDNPSFQVFLEQVRSTVIEAIAHQDFPFSLLAQRLQPDRDPSYAPLLQVAFALQTPHQGEDIAKLLTLDTADTADYLDWGGLTLEPFHIPQQEGQFDLYLELVEIDRSLIGVFKYNPDLFNADTIARIQVHFQRILEAIIHNPQQRLSELPLLTDAERQQLLVDWNQTEADYSIDCCIHHLIETQVESTPDAVALVHENQQFTYRELNHRANQLAHYLQKLGVAPDSLVGICIERSPAMVIGLLGILKAGGAYVPLDPAYPKERLGFILEDTEIPIVVTQRSLLKILPEHQAKNICLDADWHRIAQESQDNPRSPVTPNHLAYIIYTSGSTGKPKGVAAEHRNSVSVIQWLATVVTTDELSGVLAATSICFDPSVLELFAPLCYGGRILLIKNVLQLPALPASITSQITQITAVPSAIAAILPNQPISSTAISLMLGGEALHRSLVQQLYQQSQLQRVFNLYGPTETTIYATYSLIEREQTDPPVIGRPIANTQLYVLDQWLQPVPIGVCGELYIGGAGVARGYLNRPKLTQERFIPNPFSDDPQARLYKTGDWVRYRLEGNLEFRGRRDDQVKIRGFRVELGEIESVLSQHPAVQRAVVVVQTDPSRHKQLVGYILPTKTDYNIPDSIADLRQFLKAKLPEYMVPAYFVILDELPLTPTGKANRRALPIPDRLEVADRLVMPRNDVEATLATIWAEVLRLKQVGIYDSFFELGGDSILSLQVVSRANQAGLQFTPKQLFQHQTIAELTAVARFAPPQAQQDLVTGTVPLTPIQQCFFEQSLLEIQHFNQFVLLEVPPLQPDLLRKALQHLLVHHDALRLRFERSGQEWQQVNAAPDDLVPFEVVNLSESQATLEEAIATAQASLNLSQGPILRVVLFHHQSQPDRLLLVIHHLVVDGISWQILLEDLQTAYQQLKSNETIQLPPKTVSFQHWARKLIEYGRSNVLTNELNYWLTQSQTQRSALPVDHESNRAVNTVASAAKLRVSLNGEQTQSLLREIPAIYHAKTEDLLLTALAQSIAEWTGNRSLLLDVEGHGREALFKAMFEAIDLSRTVGWFTSLFPLWLHLDQLHPEAALKAVKEQRRNVPQNGIGYGILRYLSPDANIRAKLSVPSAEVCFNYLGQLDQRSAASSWSFAELGLSRSGLGNRCYLLEIDGFVLEGQMQFDWTYSDRLHHRTTIERLAQAFIQALHRLIEQSQSPETTGYTPADFPAARLNSQQLDKLMTKFKPTDRG